MKNFCFLFLLLIAGSCSLFKKTTTIKKESYEHDQYQARVATESQKNSVENSQSLVYTRDSVKDAYAIRFWPKGMLTFSPNSGLQGEFDSVTMKGNLNIQRNSAQYLSNGKVQKEIASGNLDQNITHARGQNQEEKVAHWRVELIVGVLILLILGLYCFFKRLFFNKKN